MLQLLANARDRTATRLDAVAIRPRSVAGERILLRRPGQILDY